MYTEEDTFRILRRATVEEMKEIIKTEFDGLSTEERIALFKKHGWDFRQFYRDNII